MTLFDYFPKYLIQHYLLIASIIIIYIVFFKLLIWKIILKKQLKDSSYILTFASFSSLGLVVGFMTSLSREPVTDVIVPAILTFFGGFTAYMFINDKFNLENKMQALFIILVFSFFMIYGVEVGSFYRDQYTQDQMELEHWYKKDFEYYKSSLEIYNEKE